MGACGCDNNPVPSALTIKANKASKRECAAMERTSARTSAAALPKQNPCAQCGKPIAVPDWTESLPGGRTAFLWHCRACDYRFEAVAYFYEQPALAA
jgi:ribosomal protein L37AE/L43A